MTITAAALDTETPNGAKAYDHLLRGGRGSVEALRPTRLMVERICDLYPPGVPGPRDLAIANRIYLQRAVSQAVHAGSRQVLDLGSGYPCPRLELRGAEPLRPLHEEAKAAHPQARTAYVDWDMLVVSHGLASVAGVPGVSYAHADLSGVPEVRACPDVKSVIDWGQPVTVILGLVLHFWPAATARTIVQGYLDGLQPGSRVVITVPWWDDEGLLEKVRAAYAPASLYNHGATQMMALFRGTSLLGTGIEVARGPAEVVGREVPACVLAGVGLV